MGKWLKIERKMGSKRVPNRRFGDSEWMLRAILQLHCLRTAFWTFWKREALWKGRGAGGAWGTVGGLTLWENGVDSPPQTPLITRNIKILQYWKPESHFSRSEDEKYADLLISSDLRVGQNQICWLKDWFIWWLVDNWRYVRRSSTLDRWRVGGLYCMTVNWKKGWKR